MVSPSLLTAPLPLVPWSCVEDPQSSRVPSRQTSKSFLTSVPSPYAAVMRQILSALLPAAVILCGLGCQTAGKVEEQEKLWPAYYDAEEAGDYTLAEEYLDRLEKAVAARGGRRALEMIQVDFARASVRQNQKRLGEAEQLYQQCLSNIASFTDSARPSTATFTLLKQTQVLALTELGRINVAHEEWDQALLQLEAAASIARQQVNSDPLLPVLPLHDLAILHFGLGNYPQAEAAITEALEHQEKAQGRHDINRVELLATYAVLLQKTGREKEAEEVTRQAESLINGQ